MAKFGAGAIVGTVRNKIGGVVFTKARNGASIRVRVRPANPNTAAQSGVRANMTAASRAYKALSNVNAALWSAYAGAISIYDAITGSTYHPSGIAVFNKLGAKFLQITPGGSIPTTPPATPFDGDTVSVTAAGGAGVVTFTASAANGTDVKTELLLQHKPSAHRAANPKGFRTQEFHAFTAMALTEDVTVPAGIYIPAYKFVLTTTGEQTGIVVLPEVTVT